jgi:mannose-6-phosphate isomerase-like protein (cupin superfamily)
MPVFQSGPNQAPSWCELKSFDIVELNPGENHSFERLGPKEKLIVGKGKCRVRFGGEAVDAAERTNLDIIDNGIAFGVDEVKEPTTLIRMCGDWGEELGGSGLFSADKPEERQEERGEPVDYPKETNFDAHWHDCDEYWILFEGSGTAVTEGIHFEVKAGDCVATGMGHTHDFPIVNEPVRAVYFETTMMGEKRRGHLWSHTHGPPEPKADRV